MCRGESGQGCGVGQKRCKTCVVYETEEAAKDVWVAACKQSGNFWPAVKEAALYSLGPRKRVLVGHRGCPPVSCGFLRALGTPLVADLDWMSLCKDKELGHCSINGAQQDEVGWANGSFSGSGG